MPTSEEEKEFRKRDPFWGTQMPCWYCQRCSCYTCHPRGPCDPQEVVDTLTTRE